MDGGGHEVDTSVHLRLPDDVQVQIHAVHVSIGCPEVQDTGIVDDGCGTCGVHGTAEIMRGPGWHLELPDITEIPIQRYAVEDTFGRGKVDAVTYDRTGRRLITGTAVVFERPEFLTGETVVAIECGSTHRRCVSSTCHYIGMGALNENG